MRLLALLLLPACAPVTPFSDADPATPAESAAWDALLAPDGVAVAKQVDGLRQLKVNVDDLQTTHVKVQQLVGDVPVWGGEAIAHVDARGTLLGTTDDLVPDVVVDTTPAYTADEAIDLAIQHLASPVLTADPVADLWVLRQAGQDHLVWRVQLHQVDMSADSAIPVLFIDAHSGELVWGYDNLQTATCTGTTNFYGTVSVPCTTSGSTHYLEDSTDLAATYSWGNTTSTMSYVSTTSTTFGTSQSTKNAVEAQVVSEAVIDYFKSAHGRSGIDGSGGPAAVTSHGYNFITSTTSYSRSYTNAFWDPTNLYMTYGDGDGTTSKSLTTLDIGGHEFTHGVTQYEANLTYSGESGALNESMSDVFGAMVERYALGESTDTWWMGEDTWTPSVSGDALRYMDDPAADGTSYDYYSSAIASADVHDGSGVGNLAFYLLAKGGTHPRGKSTTTVTGIGADAAADIWYLALTSYMTSSTSYAGARTATLSAAAALYGSSSTQYTQVGNAWSAVGVGGSSSSSSTCSAHSYSGSLSATGKSAYAPTSMGTSVSVSRQTASLTGTGTDFDIYLQKKSGSSWVNVASSTGATSTESLSYSGTSGTYRVRVYSSTGSGSYTLSWCR